MYPHGVPLHAAQPPPPNSHAARPPTPPSHAAHPPVHAELQKALDMVDQLVEAQGATLTLDYELAPSVYSRARVSGARSVNLWLGAGVMVEYPLDEAKALLETNLSHCKANITTCHADIAVIQASGTRGGTCAAGAIAVIRRGRGERGLLGSCTASPAARPRASRKGSFACCFTRQCRDAPGPLCHTRVTSGSPGSHPDPLGHTLPGPLSETDPVVPTNRCRRAPRRPRCPSPGSITTMSRGGGS